MYDNFKIFQIGFNKCGTSSLDDLFSKYSRPEIKTIHWDYGKLAYSIHKNILNNIPSLNDYPNINFYGDMECIIKKDHKFEMIYGFKYFYVFDKEYPNSKFILNTRNIDNWISSRLKHYSAHYLLDGELQECEEKMHYYHKHMDVYNINSVDDLILKWKYQWHTHHNNVIKYFRDRPKDLLVFDIEKDSFRKIVDFFKPYGIEFETDRLPHTNKTQVDP
jgi:hypothetical protein